VRARAKSSLWGTFWLADHIDLARSALFISGFGVQVPDGTRFLTCVNTERCLCRFLVVGPRWVQGVGSQHNADVAENRSAGGRPFLPLRGFWADGWVANASAMVTECAVPSCPLAREIARRRTGVRTLFVAPLGCKAVRSKSWGFEVGVMSLPGHGSATSCPVSVVVRVGSRSCQQVASAVGILKPLSCNCAVRFATTAERSSVFGLRTRFCGRRPSR
jgi:hypothetical protein